MRETKGQGPGQGQRGQGRPERYWTGAHTTHKLRLHLVFVPKHQNAKYRKRVLRGPVVVRLEGLLRQACEVSGWEPEELEELEEFL